MKILVCAIYMRTVNMYADPEKNIQVGSRAFVNR